MKERQIELLAPAGSYEGFEAAIGAGADAVYVGGAAFGARAYAKNFGEEELLKAIDTAHIHGKKLYLTVNTLLKNREMEERLFAYLSPFYREGLDAVIVQDLGVFSFYKKMFSKSSPSCQYADDSDRAGGNAFSGRKGSFKSGGGQGTFS